MPKARVYELAKEFGVDSKTVLNKLEAMGEFVKSASSTVEPPVARKLRNAFASNAQGNASESKKPAVPAKKPAAPAASPTPAPRATPAAPAASAAKPAAPKPARPAASKSEAPKPGQRMPRPGDSRQHGNRANGNAPRPQGERRQGGKPAPVPGPRAQRNNNNTNAPQGGNGNNAANGAKPHTPGPRPGNNPFSRKQGMHTPTPGDIPRPHPMNRPNANNNNNGEGRRGGARVRAAASVAASVVVRAKAPVRSRVSGASIVRVRAAVSVRQVGGNRFGGGANTNVALPGRQQRSEQRPARGGGRGRGGAAGAFGRQGGKSSKARKNRLAKRQEFQEMKAPVIGGVRIPTGNGQTVRLRQGASLADLAEKINVNPAALVTVLFHLGEMATATQSLDESTFQILGEEIGWDIKIVSAEEEDKELLQQFDIDLDEEELQEDEDLKPRPPVVTVMGHVDHGKTRLLDTIRRTNVIAREAGGITQRIGAYQVTVDLEGEPRKITFLDTPGHEAFTAMRARGAELTDVAILVVAADDGVMPQTVEAINHAQAANVPIVVAVNKIDKPGANPDKVRGQLTEYGLVPEEYGGNTMFVDISAKQGTNVDKLLEAVLLTADAELDLRANPDMDARGATVEARLDKGRGAVATVLVQSGTLHIGDSIVAGTSYGRVRAMLDENGTHMKEATPSTPVQVLGLTSVPTAGDLFLVASDDRTARQIAEKRQATERAAQLAKRRKVVSLESLKEQFAKAEVDMLNIVIKGDSSGSVEALEDSLMKIEVSDEVGIQVIHRGVGAITQNDVNLATVDKAVIIGFNVRPNRQVADMAEREGVEIKYYSIIYKAIEDIEASLKGMLKPEFEEVVTSHSEIREIFRSSKFGNIAGVMVQDGEVKRGTKCRILRNGIATVNDLEISSLRRFKDDVNSVKEGYEAGINLGSFNDIELGDIIETFEMQEIERK